MKKVIIIGNGIAGITAARHIRKLSNAHITVISAESEHFWSRTALMYIYMGHMTFNHTKPYEDRFWKENDINLVFDRVTSLDLPEKKVHLQSGSPMNYDSLVLATGSSPNKFGWPGQDLNGVSGMVSLQDLEAIETYTKDIQRGVIVGGGLIGIELAEMLRSRNIDVTFLIREPYFWSGVLPEQEGKMISSHIREHHVDLRENTELKEIKGDASGRVKSVITASGEEIPCEFVGLTVGVHANTSLAEGTGIETNRGFLVNEFLETSAPDVYAIGDCAELREFNDGRRAVEQVWYVGRMMGEVVARTITGNQTKYNPGPWFNSAKFFDIEYQTYGNLLAKLPEGESAFFWKAPTKDIAVHLTFRNDDLQFTGINTFGIRMRHRHFDKWLSEGAKVTTILENLEDANFDPEFFRDYSAEIRKSFALQYPEISINVKARRKKILGIF